MFVMVSIILITSAVIAGFMAGLMFFSNHETYPWWQVLATFILAVALLLGGVAAVARAKDDQRKHSDRQATRCEQIGGTPKYSKSTLNYTACEGLEQR